MSIFAHNKQASKHEVRKNFLSKNCLWDLSEIISEPFIENLTVKWHSQLERKKFYLIQNILSKKSSNNNFTLNPSKSLSRRHLISSSFNLSLLLSHRSRHTTVRADMCTHRVLWMLQLPFCHLALPSHSMQTASTLSLSLPSSSLSLLMYSQCAQMLKIKK